MTWVKGQSGNPKGRPTGKLISNALRDELKKKGTGGKLTNAEQVAWKLVQLMLAGDVNAIKLGLNYTEGLPEQRVELDVYDVARREAEARGLDPDNVISLYEALRKRRAG